MKRDMTLKDAARLEREEAREVEQRLMRHGQNLFLKAASMGWKDDGEGPLEYIIRQAYQTGLDDGKPPEGEP